MRFSLRTILIVITVVALSLGISLYLTKGYRERMTIRDDLLSLGAKCAAVDKDRRIYMEIAKPISSPKIFQKYKTIEVIELQGPAVDVSLASLQELEALPYLHIRSPNSPTLENLGNLSKVRGLHTLVFWDTPIDDSAIDIIASIDGLVTAAFRKTNITNAGFDTLRKKRPGLKVLNLP